MRIVITPLDPPPRGHPDWLSLYSPTPRLHLCPFAPRPFRAPPACVHRAKRLRRRPSTLCRAAATPTCLFHPTRPQASSSCTTTITTPGARPRSQQRATICSSSRTPTRAWRARASPWHTRPH